MGKRSFPHAWSLRPFVSRDIRGAENTKRAGLRPIVRVGSEYRQRRHYSHDQIGTWVFSVRINPQDGDSEIESANGLDWGTISYVELMTREKKYSRETRRLLRKLSEDIISGATPEEVNPTVVLLVTSDDEANGILTCDAINEVMREAVRVRDIKLAQAFRSGAWAFA